jgi:hypothetical protein
MEETQQNLYNYINTLTLPELFKTHNILSKDYTNDGLTILYNRFNNKYHTKFERDCRSIVINSNKEIVCYSCSTPYYNNEALQYLQYYETYDTFTCYEGTLLSLFNYNNTWYIASKKCIYNDTSEKTGHFKMFLDTILQDGFTDLASFGSTLCVGYTYHFVLIHHENKNIVDYTILYGEKYAKLNFAFVRNAISLVECDLSKFIESYKVSFISNNIFISEKNEYNHNTTAFNSIDNISSKPQTEGCIIKINNLLFKIQNPIYKFYKTCGLNVNLHRGFICLYQNNLLQNYFTMNPMHKTFLNNNKSYDIVGVIASIFKTCSVELYKLFNILYSPTGESKLNDLYLDLPKEYKNILYKIKGKFLANKKKNTSSENNITINNIYSILKNLDTVTLIELLQARIVLLSKLNQHFTSTINLTDNFYNIILIYSNML